MLAGNFYVAGKLQTLFLQNKKTKKNKKKHKL